MKMKKKSRILLALTVLPALITAFAVNFMADKVPMHYNASGEIDRWGSKYENFIFPVMILLFNIFWGLLLIYYNRKINKPEISDKDKHGLINNASVIMYAALGTTILFDVMQCVFLYMAYNEASKHLSSTSVDINKIIYVLVGALITVLGNVLPKSKKNGLVGIRTSWSMTNEKTWSYTHRYGGIVVSLCGILVIITALLFSDLMISFVSIGIIIISSIILCIISYKAYKLYGKDN